MENASETIWENLSSLHSDVDLQTAFSKSGWEWGYLQGLLYYIFPSIVCGGVCVS